ncbi:MAG: phosphodiester glycosidase family protein [Clostridia bacterium]|nr:phosphodiester glycosidase family protein [Clostridia bacterium]
MNSKTKPRFRKDPAASEDLIIKKLTKKSKRAKILGVFFSCFSGLAVICTVLFSLFIYSSIPFFSYWRGIWVETAMTTMNHRWLATAFIPGYQIDKIMGETINPDIIGGANALVTTSPVISDTLPAETEPPAPTDHDPLKQKELNVGDKDYAGNTVLINDIEEGIIVSEISRGSFKGKIMLIDDPSRVYVGSTPYPGEKGLRIRAMMDHYGAIAGINASGFIDPQESGHGGEIVGLSCSMGNFWGEYAPYYGSIVLTNDNKLVVGNISVWQGYNIRDGIQFGPVLIADGEAQVKGSAGYGLHPRTAIGQREDGVIAFLVIDGRDVTHSIGCTVGDLAKILLEYGIVNAACCDGGASSVLAYNGEVITKNCSLNPAYGRPLPNAFLVRSKNDIKNTQS